MSRSAEDRRRRRSWAAPIAGAAVLGALGTVRGARGGGASAVPATTGSGDPRPGDARSAGARVQPAFPLTIGQPVGRPIPAGFLGFSIEFQAIRAYTGSDPAQINPVLVQLIRNLSPGQAPVIRIGGDSTDASWVPTAGVKPPPQVTYTLTPSWFATTDALVRALGARVIVGHQPWCQPAGAGGGRSACATCRRSDAR